MLHHRSCRHCRHLALKSALDDQGIYDYTLCTLHDRVSQPHDTCPQFDAVHALSSDNTLDDDPDQAEKNGDL